MRFTRRALLMSVAGAAFMTATAAAMPYLADVIQRRPSAPVIKVRRIAVLDQSDPNSSLQNSAITEVLENTLPLASRQGDELLAYLLLSTPDDPIQRYFKSADPGGKNDEVLWDWLHKNPKRLEEFRQTKFVSRWIAATQAMQVPAQRPQTPLVEGLSLLTRLPEYWGRGTSTVREIYLISDGLQHLTAGVSAYTGTLYGSKGKRYVESHVVDLLGAKVVIYYITRHKNRHQQTNPHRGWLEHFLLSGGASSVEIRLL